MGRDRRRACVDAPLSRRRMICRVAYGARRRNGNRRRPPAAAVAMSAGATLAAGRGGASDLPRSIETVGHRRRPGGPDHELASPGGRSRRTSSSTGARRWAAAGRTAGTGSCWSARTGRPAYPGSRTRTATRTASCPRRRRRLGCAATPRSSARRSSRSTEVTRLGRSAPRSPVPPRDVARARSMPTT